MTISSSSSSLASCAPQLRLAVLLLAAGEGSRLGSKPKTLLKKDGQTLLSRFCTSIATFSPVEFLVVTGFHAEAINFELERLVLSIAFPIRVAYNANPERGQASSVRLGLESLLSDFDVLLVALSDQPFIGVDEIQALLEEFSRRQPGEEIILPVVNGRRGNPVLCSAKAIAEILSSPQLVCRTYMDTHPDKVRMLFTANNAFVLDVDTPEDIQTHQLT